MASPQQVPEANLNNEEAKVLEEMIKQRDSLVVDDGEEHAIMTYGFIGNFFERNLLLKIINEYSGHFDTSGPAQEIKVKEITSFIHEGTPPNGSNGHQWVLAWSVPFGIDQHPATQPTFNQVYVEDGAEAQIDWSKIEKKLDATTNPVSVSPGAYAIITKGSKAGVVAMFHEPRPLN